MSEKLMRSIARLAGFGRMSFKTIERCDESKASRYLSKYLGKKRPECLKGWQLARTFGVVDSVRLIDIEKTSALTEAWAIGATIPRWKKLTFREKSSLALQIRWRMYQGEVWSESFTSSLSLPPCLVPF
jgi:hypothetical protein